MRRLWYGDFCGMLVSPLRADEFGLSIKFHTKLLEIIGIYP
jgi:hypothetical protein